MRTMALPDYFWQVLLEADKVGIKLEMVGGVPMWEMMPGPRHQEEVDRIRASIHLANKGSDCGCFHYPDVAIRFADGSFKRPDIAIFCTRPPERDEATKLIPEAVVEVVSPGYEAKDYTFGSPFYLSQGVKDVIIFDPRTLAVVHARKDGTKHLISVLDIALECGCAVTV
jgi:Uma2 family endonuclease